jgi:hypothetical protein
MRLYLHHSSLGHPFGPQAHAHERLRTWRAISVFHAPHFRRFLQTLTNRGIHVPRLKMQNLLPIATTIHFILEGSINDSRHLEMAATGAGFDSGEVS